LHIQLRISTGVTSDNCLQVQSLLIASKTTFVSSLHTYTEGDLDGNKDGIKDILGNEEGNEETDGNRDGNEFDTTDGNRDGNLLGGNVVHSPQVNGQDVCAGFFFSHIFSIFRTDWELSSSQVYSFLL